MTVLEKGAFVNKFVRTKGKNERLIKVPRYYSRNPHSGIDYHSDDMKYIEQQIDPFYLEEWQRYIFSKKDEKDQMSRNDYCKFLKDLEKTDDSEFKGYELPTSFIVVKNVDTMRKEYMKERFGR